MNIPSKLVKRMLVLLLLGTSLLQAQTPTTATKTDSTNKKFIYENEMIDIFPTTDDVAEKIPESTIYKAPNPENKKAEKEVKAKPLPKKPANFIPGHVPQNKNKGRAVINSNKYAKRKVVSPLPPSRTIENRRNVIQNNKLIQSSSSGNYPFNTEQVPAYNDQTYRSRLNAIPSIVRLEYNEFVGKFIEMYTVYKREQVEHMLARSDLYFNKFEDALLRHDLPIELKFLPIIESALIPHARSVRGGAGLWQLTYSTASLYGLEANSFIDERLDPLLSTEVAVKHLKNLYKKYKNWHFVIAAYNCGEGTLNKAIKRSGSKTNYWDIAEYLPLETQAYVPLFIAATYVMNYHPEHNLYKHDSPFNYYVTDTVVVKRALELRQVARFLNMPLEELQFLNPAIKQNVIPLSTKGYPLTLPMSKIGFFEIYLNNLNAKNKETLIRHHSYMVNLPPDNPWNFPMNAYNIERSTKKSKTITLVVTVEENQTLSDIAFLYDCSIEDIKRWNEMYRNTLKTGEKLYINVLREHREIYEGIKLRKNKGNSNGEKVITKPTKRVEPIVYEVSSRDTVESICKKFPDVTRNKILTANQLTGKKLKAGMILIIPPPN